MASAGGHLRVICCTSRRSVTESPLASSANTAQSFAHCANACLISLVMTSTIRTTEVNDIPSVRLPHLSSPRSRRQPTNSLTPTANYDSPFPPLHRPHPLPIPDQVPASVSVPSCSHTTTSHDNTSRTARPTRTPHPHLPAAALGHVDVLNAQPPPTSLSLHSIISRSLSLATTLVSIVQETPSGLVRHWGRACIIGGEKSVRRETLSSRTVETAREWVLGFGEAG